MPPTPKRALRTGTGHSLFAKVSALLEGKSVGTVEDSRSVLVTGGAGFIGTALSERLAPRFARWVAFDSLHPQIHRGNVRPKSLNSSAELVAGDVMLAADWDSLFDVFRPDIVIHLAAETGTSQSLNEASRHAKVNVVGTTEMTDALTRHGIRPDLVVLASSRAVYGEGTWRDLNGREFSPGLRSHQQLISGQWDFPNAVPLASSAGATAPHPVNVYGATKLAQELLLEAWCGSYDVPRSVLRLQNVYGPGQSLINSYTGIVSLFSQLAEKKLEIPVYEDGGIVRDFVFIDDVVTAFESVICGSHVTGPVDVGSGVPTTLLEIATLIADYHGAPAPRVSGEFRDGDVRYAVCVVDAAVEQIDWNPQWGLDRGLAALQVWIAEQEPRITAKQLSGFRTLEK